MQKNLVSLTNLREDIEMKKKLLSVILTSAMIATLLVGCGKEEEVTTDPAATTEDVAPTEAAATTDDADATVAAEGKVFNIYCWNEEFQSRVKDYYPDYVDNGDGTGKNR